MIELNAILNEFSHDSIANNNVIKKLRSLKSKSEKEKLKEKIQWEIDFLQFELQNGKANPYMEFTLEDGTSSGHPNFNLFSDEAIEYFIGRVSSVSNKWLCIHYNQVLWNCKKSKNLRFSKSAIELYLELFDELGNSSIKLEQYRVIELFENGVTLSENTNYKQEEFKEIWNDFINSGKILQGYWRTKIIDVTLQFKSYSKIDYQGKIELCIRLYKEFLVKKSFNTTLSILNTAISIAKKYQEDVKPLYKLLGENYECEANQESNDPSNFITCTCLVNALENYQEAKDEKKIEEVAIRLAKLRKDLKLDLIKIDFTNPASIEIRKSLEEKAKNLLELNVDEIYSYLSNGNDQEIFIGESALDENTANDPPSFLDSLNSWNIDINNNQRENSKNDFDPYDWYIKFELNYFLFMLFTEGIESGKIDYNSFTSYLHKKTWLGQTFKGRSGGGNLRQYTWLGLIAPSIKNYFVQTQLIVDNKGKKYNYILCVDSLTMKFEGLLRDFADLIGCETIIYSKRLKGTREMYIEEILNLEKIKEYFNETDRAMFSYIFTKNGMDLRNNIAHSFLRFPDYGFMQMHLLLLTILRLGKYQVKV